MRKEFTSPLQNKKILLDSNTYFRLADNLYPLLSNGFGTNPTYKLCILGGTLREYNYQARLQSKFDWVDNEKHKEDRKKNKLRLSQEINTSINATKKFVLETSKNRELGCSLFDIECLVTALEINIPLVTDDEDLFILADEYDVVCMSTLELLKLMLDNNRVTLKEIQDTVYIWDYMKDIPRNFHADFLSLFGVEPETYG